MSDQYKSEITQFLENYKKTHPDVEKHQRAGRARLWDKQQDAELADGFKQARVPQAPYVYQND
jgi:putative IMPACT (imprinted ancient) family translation regulator